VITTLLSTIEKSEIQALINLTISWLSSSGNCPKNIALKTAAIQTLGIFLESQQSSMETHVPRFLPLLIKFLAYSEPDPITVSEKPEKSEKSLEWQLIYNLY